LGYKYVKNSDVLLYKKDIDKAKKKIKNAKQLNLNSKDLRRKINKEVMKVQAKSKVRKSALKSSVNKVEELEVINDDIESAQKDRDLTASKLLKKRNNG